MSTNGGTLGTGTFKPERNLAFKAKIYGPSTSTIVTINIMFIPKTFTSK